MVGLYHKMILTGRMKCAATTATFVKTRKLISNFYVSVWHIPLLYSVQWINSWWWTDGLLETCTISCQNKFVKLVHLVGFIIQKFVTMRGHVNVKFVFVYFILSEICWYRKCFDSWMYFRLQLIIIILISLVLFFYISGWDQSRNLLNTRIIRY